MEGLILIIFQVVVLLYSVVIHEVSHGVTANALGDPTAKNLGRLNLNPIKHLDFFGSFLLPLFLFLTSPFIFGYAKPVPYNPNNLSDRKYGPLKVAISGPLANIILATLFGLVLRFMPGVFLSGLIIDLFKFIVFLNLQLAVFNLFPIPPLDGHWVLMTFLPERFLRVRIFLYRYSIFLLIFFIIFIYPIIFPATTFLFKLITGVGF